MNMTIHRTGVVTESLVGKDLVQDLNHYVPLKCLLPNTKLTFKPGQRASFTETIISYCNNAPTSFIKIEIPIPSSMFLKHTQNSYMLRTI